MCNLLEEEEEEKKKNNSCVAFYKCGYSQIIKKNIYILLCLLNLAKMTPIAALKMQL